MIAPLHKATLDLVVVAGGIDNSYIPTKATPDHPWVKVIGIDKFTDLTKALGGQRLYIPRGSFLNMKKIQILDMLDKSICSREIALHVGCSERYVRQLMQTDNLITSANPIQPRLL